MGLSKSCTPASVRGRPGCRYPVAFFKWHRMLCVLSPAAQARSPIDFTDPISNSGASLEGPKTAKIPFFPGGLGMKRLGLAVLAVAVCMIATRAALGRGHLPNGIRAEVRRAMGTYKDGVK